LNIRLKHYGEDHIECEKTLYNLCITLGKLGEYYKAYNYYLHVLKIEEKKSEEDHTYYPTIFKNVLLRIRSKRWLFEIIKDIKKTLRRG
jgi:hypothetical protein